MAEIVDSIDISRRPGDVFAYAADFSHFPEMAGGASCRRAGRVMALFTWAPEPS